MPLLTRRRPSPTQRLLERCGDLGDRLPDELIDRLPDDVTQRLREPTAEEARVALATLRLVFGAAWLAPNAVARAFAIDVDRQESLALLGRLFAARDALLGASLLVAEGEELDRLLCWGVAVNTADAAAALLAGLRRRVSWRSALAVAATAGAAVYLGVAAQRP